MKNHSIRNFFKKGKSIKSEINSIKKCPRKIKRKKKEKNGYLKRDKEENNSKET